ncbi:hypothetical protein AB0L05_15850 [Nonomuraea pusilla]|uniref:hypothetical protein n=1 Tax=Nonomuraea pusilla TaxID=46177 RepID=UPI00331E1218
MPVVWAALAILCVICLLNLLPTVAVIRRLRERTELINRRSGQSSGQAEITLPAGTRVGGFRVVTGDDRVVTLGDLRQGAPEELGADLLSGSAVL